MRSRIDANNLRGTATSAIWNVTALESETTLAPILISFSRSVVRLQCFTSRGSASYRRKFPRVGQGEQLQPHLVVLEPAA